MPSIKVHFGQGTQDPPNLGLITLPSKPAEEGKMGYSQNVVVSSNKYGKGVVVPGPYQSPYSTSLTNPVYWKALMTQDVGSKHGQLWVGYDTTNTLDYLKNVNAGNAPTYETSGTVTLSVSGHTPIISDMESAGFPGSGIGSQSVYVSLNDTTNPGYTWIANFQSSSTTTIAGLTSSTVVGVISNPLPMVKTQFDGKIYIGNGPNMDRIDPSQGTLSTATTRQAIGTSGQALPNEWFFTAMGEWNGLLVGAANNTAPGDFTQRNGSTKSRIYFWDIANNPTGNFKTNFINSPSHYISVLLTDLSGNLLAFGGVDEGRTTIYQYNGYGFDPIFSYIGDMPRNRHSAYFDSIGRLIWNTADGQVCRYERSTEIFEHMSTVNNSLTKGGICTNLQATGTDFLISGNAFLGKLNLNDLFTGDGGAGTAKTPIAVSGILDFPQKSILTTTIVSLNKALQQGEKLDIVQYPQNYADVGTTVLGSLDYAVDGAVASKQIRNVKYNIDEMAVGITWKTSDGTSTVPGVTEIELQYNQISTT